MKYISENYIDGLLSEEFSGDEAGVNGTDGLKGDSLNLTPSDKSDISNVNDTEKDDTWQIGDDMYPDKSLIKDDIDSGCPCGADDNGEVGGDRGAKIASDAVDGLFS